MLTSNKTLAEWSEVVGDEVLGTACGSACSTMRRSSRFGGIAIGSTGNAWMGARRVRLPRHLAPRTTPRKEEKRSPVSQHRTPESGQPPPLLPSGERSSRAAAHTALAWPDGVVVRPRQGACRPCGGVARKAPRPGQRTSAPCTAERPQPTCFSCPFPTLFRLFRLFGEPLRCRIHGASGSLLDDQQDGGYRCRTTPFVWIPPPGRSASSRQSRIVLW